MTDLTGLRLGGLNMNATKPAESGQGNSAENLLDIGGYLATVNPRLMPDGSSVGDSPYETNDTTSLNKLRSAGLDVASLMDAYTTYHIAPIRHWDDLWKILGYSTSPGGKGKHAFGMDHVTGLAFLYPIPHEPGKTFTAAEYIRVRPSNPIRGKDKDHKYLQPSRPHTVTHSEPYFLMTPDMWTRVMNPEFPLFITEGECKAIALGLTNVAAIAFPGVQMMYADKKNGKNKPHPVFDPEGPRKGKTIPIADRDIYLVPDSDFVENKDVRLGFRWLVKNLTVCGASPDRIKMVVVPPPSQVFGKVGIDDFLTERLGPRWGGNEEKVVSARAMIDGLVECSKYASINDYLYSATSHIRGAERFIAKFDQPDKYLGVIQASAGVRHNLWAMYNCDHYITYPINLPLNNTSTKMSFKDDELNKMAHDTWEEGVRIESQEEDQDGERVGEMNADYPNRMFGLVQPYLPCRYNETLIEPFEGVGVNDHCLRIRGGLINVTRCFQTGVDWSRRIEWLLPPNYRWFGTSQVAVSLSNLDTRPLCPTFDALIQNMFDGDPESIDCLQKSFGKILLSPLFLDWNNFLALYGTAGSGKSTLTNLIIKLIGMHDVAILRGNFGGRFDTSELPGKRLILFPENEDGSDHHFTKEMTTTVKKISGRDMIVCERKGQQPISARIDAELMIVGNSPPSMEMDPDAFLRRAVFLKATRKIPMPDMGISRERMENEEFPGILLWALEGACKLWKGAPYKTPTVCHEDVGYSTLSANPETRFVEAMIVEKEGKKLFVTDMEDMYRAWLRSNRFPAKEPGWGRLTGAIRKKFGDKYVSEPSKDSLRRNTRMYRGLTIAEMMF